MHLPFHFDVTCSVDETPSQDELRITVQIHLIGQRQLSPTQDRTGEQQNQPLHFALKRWNNFRSVSNVFLEQPPSGHEMRLD